MMKARGRMPCRVVFPCLVAVAVLAGCAGFSLGENVDSLMEEGRQLYAAGRYDEAIAKFERVIEKDRLHWLAYVYLARSYLAKHVWPSAIASARYSVIANEKSAVRTAAAAALAWSVARPGLASSASRYSASALV